MKKTRCPWAKSENDIVYHDTEWGVPSHDDNYLFEMLILEGFQAGLSWHGVLQKREAMREAFDGFDPEKIKLYGEDEIAKFMQNERLIRNRLKLKSLSVNALALLSVTQEFGSFYDYLWGYLLKKFDPKFDGKQIINHYQDIKQVPATTPMSDFVAKELKKRGFKFLGSVGTYAFLQSVGVVDDHMDYCFCKAKG